MYPVLAYVGQVPIRTHDVLVALGPGASNERLGQAALHEVRTLFQETEAILSRFLPDSELSRLNQSAGRPFRASPVLFEVVSSAFDAARDTGGLFDPTFLPALRAAGYDRSFENVEQDTDAPPPSGPEPTPDWPHVWLDANDGTINSTTRAYDG